MRRPATRSWMLLAVLALPLPALPQTADGDGWKPTGYPLVPRIRLAAEILDSEPAVLEAELRGEKVPFLYSVDWGDGSRPEVGRRHSPGALRLTHDYDGLGTFAVRLEVRRGKDTTRLEPSFVNVQDDDGDIPELTWSLPSLVLRPDEPAVVGWEITDASGLEYVSVVVQGPAGRLASFDSPKGAYDLRGHGLGKFGIEVQTRDADADRPGDGLGFMIIEGIMITDDVDGDGILDYLDNCPELANPEQVDTDHDRLGDGCDPCPRKNGPCDEPAPAASGGPGRLDPPGGSLPRNALLLLVATILSLLGVARTKSLGSSRWLSLTLIAFILGPTSAFGVPSVSAVRPTAVLVGEPVVIRGSDFGASQGAMGRVTFGGVDAGTVYHWTDDRITVEVPVGSLVAGVPTPTPKGLQPVVVRNSAGETSSPVQIDVQTFDLLPRFRPACRCGDAGCVGPCLPNDYCRLGAGGCVFETRAYARRDIKDVDFGDLDEDGDLDVLDVSSPTQPGFPGSPEAGAGLSPTGCDMPVNFPDRLFVNNGAGRFTDITGGADGNYESAADNPLPFFHSFRTYDADLFDVNNDGYLDVVRADRAFCSGDNHYFVNVDTSGDGLPDNKFSGRALAPPAEDVYWDNLATGDVDGDGDLDVLVSHSQGIAARHALLLNDGSGFFTPYDPATMAGSHAANDDFTPFQSSSHDMFLVDLDQDRDQDIVIGGGNHNVALTNLVLLNRRTETGDLFFESIPIPRAGETSRTVSLGVPDVNGDGRPDVHFVNMDPADRLFLNLGLVDCGSGAESGCPDTLSCSGAGQVVANRICWRDATADLPEELAGVSINGYGSDYGDVDADGDLDILVTGLGWPAGNYLFLNRAGTACSGAGDCPAGYDCISGGCRPSSPSTTPKWWSCPQAGSGPSAVPCRDRTGATVVGPGFPGEQVPDHDLAVVFGDVDGDTDLDVLWGRGQWADWTKFGDAGPLLLIGDGERPYVKRVTVFSGPRIVYQAAWAPNAPGTELVIAPSTFAAAAPFTALRTQDIHLEVEFSEPMASVSLVSVSPLGTVPTMASSQPADGRTIWRGTISNLDVADDGSDDGTHTITLDGQDMVGNALLSIASRANIPVGAVRSGAAGPDTIHGFRIGPLEGVIPVTALFMKQTVADPATPPIADKALALQTALNAYFDEVSYGEISFAVTGHGWYALDQPLAWYYTTPRTPLVDLVQEALDDAQADGVSLAGGYVLVVTDETAPRDEWSTTGGWPYTVGGGPQLLASGVLNLATTDPRLTHLSGRLVGLVDLFAHPEVTVSRPFVGPWSHMSERDREVHVLGWEKWRVGWLDETGTATGKLLTRVPKPVPAAPPIVGQSHFLLPLDSDTDGVKMLAVEIAPSLHFTAEYRRQQAPLDDALPDAGVLIVKSNDLIPGGEGPAILQESAVTAGNLDDAPFVVAPPRHRFDDAGSGVGIEVVSITAAQAEIRLDYTLPPTQNDVFVAPHDDSWVTEDIWVDAPDAALTFAADPLTVRTANEKPVTGFLNKVYGRVRNQGGADATNFEVELEILEPWGTGGPWRSLKVDIVPLLQGQATNPGDDYLIVADWVPVGDVHTCVRLRVRGLANDVNPDNNETQENIHEFVSTPGSPYSPITSVFQVENPYDETIPVLFRLDGLPAGWSHVFTPDRPVLAPRSTGTVRITLQPNDAAPLCTREEVTLTAWAPRVDTLKRLGGLTLAVELKSPASLTATTRLECKQGSETTVGDRVVATRGCALVTQGCTDPGLPNTEVAVVYTAPDGTVAVRYVTTDGSGCFVDVVPAGAPGLWQVSTTLEEEDCRQGDRTPTTPVFVPPPFGFGDAGRGRYLGIFAGGGWPLSDLDEYSPGFLFSAQLEWELTPSFRLGVQTGYQAFDAEPSAGVDNLGFTHLSAIARLRGGGTTLVPFLLGGIGGYESDGHWDPGIEVGVGFEVPLTVASFSGASFSGAASLAAGIDFHAVDRNTTFGSRPTWTDAYLGFFVRLP